MTPPSRREIDRKPRTDPALDLSSAVAELRVDVENGEKSIDELKRAIEDLRKESDERFTEARTSSSELRKSIETDRTTIIREIGDLKTWIAGIVGEIKGRSEAGATGKSDVKWVVTTIVALIGLAIALWPTLRGH